MTKPFWSVMMPVYRPDSYLEEALRSVLAQGIGPDRMQIQVVDDCPDDTQVDGRIRALAGGRIEFSKNEKNLGLAGNWNRCIERARGQWVHLLHHDDRVYPGFYDKLENLIRRHPEAGAAVTANDFIGSKGEPLDFGDRLLQRHAGVLEDAVSRLAVSNLLQCPAIVVKKTTYESVGGFDAKFKFALDWEMWVRIARSFPLLYLPEELATYRIHQGSETSALAKSGETVRDCYRAIDRISTYVPTERRKLLKRRAIEWAADMAYHRGHQLMNAGKVELAMAQFRPALRRERRLAAWKNAVVMWRHGIRLTKRVTLPPLPCFPQAWCRVGFKVGKIKPRSGEKRGLAGGHRSGGG